MVSNTPTEFSVDLTDERLNILCEHILDTIQDSISDSSTVNDTAWTKGCLPYGRLQGLMQRLAIDKNYPWLSLANKTMDFTATIGSAHIQFLIDDPYCPKKTHRLQTNAVENMQLSMVLEVEDIVQVVHWRLFIVIDKDDDDQFSPVATLVGYDLNQNSVCIWEHQDTAIIPMAASHTPVIDIPEPEISRKEHKDDVNNVPR